MQTRSRRSTGIIALCIVFAGAIGFLLVGLYLGPMKFVANGGVAWVEILPTTFAVWENQSPRDHFFSAFLNPSTAAAGQAYAHYSQPLLLLQYLCLQPLRWFGVPYSQAQSALSAPHLAVLLLLLASLLSGIESLGLRPLRPQRLFRSGVLVVAIAAAITLPAFWVPFFRFNPEQYFFIPALAFCYLAGVDYDAPPRTRDALLTLLPIALFAPLFAPFAIASWIVLWHLGTNRDELPDALALAVLAVIGLLGGFVFALPSLIEPFTSLQFSGSGIWFRSGLDGSEEYFTSMAQALWAPSYPLGRPWHVWHWPLCAVAAIAAAVLHSPATAARMARQLFVSWLPLAWMVVVFPQLVSIHPYFFDFHITLAPAVCFAFWLQRPELALWTQMPSLRMAILLGCGALLMTNLIDLARMAAR